MGDGISAITPIERVRNRGVVSREGAGMRHGALDVDAIRRIEQGEETANQAFLHAGVGFTMPEPERLRTIAMFAAMECASLLLLAPDATRSRGSSTGESPWATSGLPQRASRDVFASADETLGIPVDR